MYIDGALVDVKAGSAVRVNPSAVRSFRNSSLTEQLYLICIRAQGGPIKEIIEDSEEPVMFDWDEVM
jgi:hypothetical protein